MLCPRCDKTMDERVVKDAPVSRCKGCHGTWVPANSLAAMLPGTTVGWGVVRQLDRVVTSEHPGKSPLVCPSCSAGPMRTAKIRSVPLDICGECHGVYFDAGEVGRLTRKHRKSIRKRVERRWQDSTQVRESNAGADATLLAALIYMGAG